MTKNMFLFRAMCKEELYLTLKFNSLQYFRNREKCFSPYMYWIVNVVMNGRFNNSYSKLDRYMYLACFCIPTSEKHKFRRYKLEWKTDVRKQVKVNKIIVLWRNRGGMID